LTEAHLGSGHADWIVVGIGINVRAREFPPEIAAIATSLALAGAATLDRAAIFVDLASALSRRLDALHAGGAKPLVDAFAARDALAGRAVTIDGSPATAIGIAGDGALRIRRPDGSEATCIAGEVRLA
jgi:BirA family biotin operon repressor/biotin-[acetyl-CoA-carboxylase] ligase